MQGYTIFFTVHGNTDLDGQITMVSVSLPMLSKKMAAASPNSESVK